MSRERMIRTIFAWTVGLTTTVITGMVAIFLSLFDSSGNLSHLAARLWGKIQLRTTGTRVTVQGLEYLDPRKSYILVSNHQSFFDIFSLLGYLPLQFRWIAKAELFRIPLLGWAMSRTGYISDRAGQPQKGLSQHDRGRRKSPQRGLGSDFPRRNPKPGRQFSSPLKREYFSSP